MTLEKKLGQLNNDELIYIGSKSAFFFIGSVDEFRDRHYSVQMEWKKKLQANLESANNKIEIHMKKKPEEGKDEVKEFKNFLTGKMEEVRTSYEELYKDWEAHLNNLIKYREACKNHLAKFKPFMKRQVKESYHRIDPDDGTVIIIRGGEVGNYWFLSDVKKKYIGEYDDEQDYDID